MPLKKFGEKLKSSFHHLSPKSKKHDEAADGDLSPCSLPTVATSQQQQPVQQSAPPIQQICSPSLNCANETNKLAEDKPPVGTLDQPKAQEVPESMRIQTPCLHLLLLNQLLCPPDDREVNYSPCGCEIATPRWQVNECIFPTMYYLIKTHNRDPITQSVLLVNPSKSDKTFNLRLSGGHNAALENETASIAGGYVERVNVTFTPVNETEDLYIDLLHGGNLYDKIRVQSQLLES